MTRLIGTIPLGDTVPVKFLGSGAEQAPGPRTRRLLPDVFEEFAGKAYGIPIVRGEQTQDLLDGEDDWEWQKRTTAQLHGWVTKLTITKTNLMIYGDGDGPVLDLGTRAALGATIATTPSPTDLIGRELVEKLVKARHWAGWPEGETQLYLDDVRVKVPVPVVAGARWSH